MYYRQPRYYSEFQCVGGTCIDNCCYGWRIDWTKEEIEKVKKAGNISPELKEAVENGFSPNKKFNEKFQINFKENGKCPFQTEEGLCRIQKELGAEYLSHTCTIYPRRELAVPTCTYRFMSMSCREIIRKLLFEENACDLISAHGSKEFEKRDFSFTKNVLEKRPEMKYYKDIFEFCYELISDKRITVETAIVFGALAAQKLMEIAGRKEIERIPEALKAFQKQFHNPEQIKKIENIKSNYNLKLGFMSELMEKIIRSGLTPLLHDQTGTLNIDLYNKGEQGLREALKGREYFLRNLALNLLFEFNVPFCFESHTIFENYSIFAAAFGLLKLNLIAACCSGEHNISYKTDGRKFVYEGDDKLIGTTAIICRGICQSRDKEEVIIGLLNAYKFTTPAYLALLIK